MFFNFNYFKSIYILSIDNNYYPILKIQSDNKKINIIKIHNSLNYISDYYKNSYYVDMVLYNLTFKLFIYNLIQHNYDNLKLINKISFFFNSNTYISFFNINFNDGKNNIIINVNNSGLHIPKYFDNFLVFNYEIVDNYLNYIQNYDDAIFNINQFNISFKHVQIIFIGLGFSEIINDEYIVTNILVHYKINHILYTNNNNYYYIPINTLIIKKKNADPNTIFVKYIDSIFLITSYIKQLKNSKIIPINEHNSQISQFDYLEEQYIILKIIINNVIKSNEKLYIFLLNIIDNKNIDHIFFKLFFSRFIYFDLFDNTYSHFLHKYNNNKFINNISYNLIKSIVNVNFINIISSAEYVDISNNYTYSNQLSSNYINKGTKINITTDIAEKFYYNLVNSIY